MAIKGGYKIIDFKGIALSSTEAIIPGIYAAIEENYDKCLIVSGVNYDDAIYNDEIVDTPELDSTDYLITFHRNYIIRITDDDEVTIGFRPAPTAADDPGTPGDIAVGDGKLYVCDSEGAWGYVELTAFE